MKRTCGGAALGLLLLLLAACSAGSGGDSGADGQRHTAEKPPETRTIEHLKGKTEIPAKIDSIVVLSAAYIDHLLTIGEKPSGVNVEARYGGDYLPYLASRLQGTKLVGSADSPNLEAILEIAPDVIIIESRTAETTYEQLKKIAPTIVLGTEWLDYASDWTLDLMTVAAMYDKTEQAKQAVAALNDKIAKAKGKVEGIKDRRLAYLRVREKMMQIYAQGGHPTNVLLYQELGFQPAALTPKDQRANLSLESIPDIQADFVVLEVDPNGTGFLQEMRQGALWSKLPAVQHNRVYESDSFWLFKGWGVIGRGEIVDDVLRMLP